MPNLGTLVLRVADAYQLGGNALGPGAKHGEQIRLSIWQALQTLRREPHPWNTDEGTLELVVDQAEYTRNAVGGADVDKLPPGWMRMLSDELQLDGGPADYDTVTRVDDLEFDRCARGWAGTSGQPEIWRDFGSDRIKLAPAPDAEDYVLSFRYLRDLGREADFLTLAGDVSTGWTGTLFTEDTFSNAWFEEDKGWDLLFSQAGYLFGSTYLAGREDKVARVQAFATEMGRQGEGEAKLTLKKRWPLTRAPYFGESRVGWPTTDRQWR